ncbi:MAG: hypothetical protein EPO08_05095 [Rhodospirillaceae bacterium]|nr:MAG: hypothetical protein EPO08_05095 [Rhodospirillaceae bacterium]
MNVALKSETRGAAKADAHASVSLLPTHPGGWAQYKHERLFQLGWKDLEEVQLAALQHRFSQMKDGVAALERLAKKQGVTRIDSISDALPLFFDHRVYKSYPLTLIESRDFPKLTSWLNRLTLHNLLKMDLSGLKTLDGWLDRLQDYGMMIGHSTGTTGKLSFIPRSRVEWPSWNASYTEAYRAATDIDPTKEFLPTFVPSYRGGHQMGQKMMWMFNTAGAGGPEEYHTLYQTPLSADLMSLAGRLQSAEDKGELDRLALDPVLLQKRQEMIAQGRRREQDMEAWFTKLIDQYRGRRVKVGGTFGDLTRVALSGKAKGLKCSFASNSIIMSGGGMKGYKDAPPDWKDQIKKFFGIERFCSMYGMSECVGSAPMCEHGFFHFMPFIIPILLDKDARELPREGIQTGRLALFDLLAETYWGGFISGDQVTMHWDENCACGWKGPRIETTITRFAEMEGGDDKITCAGSQQAYNEFMDYVMQV